MLAEAGPRRGPAGPRVRVGGEEEVGAGTLPGPPLWSCRNCSSEQPRMRMPALWRRTLGSVGEPRRRSR